MLKASTFVEWLRSKAGLGYVYGSFGQIIDIAFLKQVDKMYGSIMGYGYFQRNGDYKLGRCARWLGKVAYDCSGLIKAGRKELTGVWKDLSAQGTYDSCLQKGKLTSVLLPGTAVFMYQANRGRMVHVGIYIGNGEVIEARGVDYGVVVTKLSSRAWTHYGTLSWLHYDLSDKGLNIDANNKKDNDSGDGSTPKVDDPTPDTTQRTYDEEVFYGHEKGVLTSLDYWQDVIEGKVQASATNIRFLIQKYNKLI